MNVGTYCENCMVTEVALQAMRSTPRRQIEAHHEDYRLPYDVVYLCVKCHNELHKYRRAVGLPMNRNEAVGKAQLPYNEDKKRAPGLKTTIAIYRKDMTRIDKIKGPDQSVADALHAILVTAGETKSHQ